MAIGDKTFFRGNEVTVTSEPYKLYGGWFVDCIDNNGEKVTVATKEQRQADASTEINNWKNQQAQFRKLR